MKRELLVGLVFAGLLGGLVGMTLWVEKPGLFRGTPPFHMTTRFHDVAGLREGGEAWIYGTVAGRVEKIRPDGKGAVLVDLDLNYDPQMHADSVVKISQSSALGGAIVSIHPGTEASPRISQEIYDGRSVSDPFQEISNAVAELKEPLKNTVESAKKVFADFSQHSDQIASNLDKTLDNLKTVSDDLKEHKGTLGKLLGDDKPYEDLKEAIAGLKKIADDANGAGGTIDVLLHDKTVAGNMSKSIENLRTVSDDLVAGKGTIGKLFKDDSLYDRLDAAAGDIGSLVADAKNGKGLLHTLIYDEAIGKRLDTISDDVATITGKVRRGEGTLGKLINDDKLYADLQNAIKKLGGGVDDVRENAPILTFAGFLFKGF